MRTSSLLIANGKVVNADGGEDADVLVADSRIAAVGRPGSFSRDDYSTRIDAGGCLVLPGGVDPHCHVAMTIGGYTTEDDYEQVSVAALHGGTTTIVDFAIPVPGQSPLEAARERREMAARSRCSTALHGCVIEWTRDSADELARMASEGTRTIKLFTTYRGQIMANPDTVLNVVKHVGELGGLAYIHAESDHIIRDVQGTLAEESMIDARHHAATRPEISEEDAVHQVLSIARQYRAPVYFVHQTTRQSIALINALRWRDVRAYAETCPHYFTLDDRCYAAADPERFVCCPPLRSSTQTEAVRGLIGSGAVDTIGSDHCGYSLAQKREHGEDVRVMPNGMPGVETRIPISYSQLVATGLITPERFVALTSANPAKLNGLFPRKGRIAPGSDADILVLDPSAHRRIDTAADLHMASDYTPYSGLEVTGWPAYVVSAGRIVVDRGEFADPGPVGERLPSAPMGSRLLC